MTNYTLSESPGGFILTGEIAQATYELTLAALVTIEDVPSSYGSRYYLTQTDRAKIGYRGGDSLGWIAVRDILITLTQQWTLHGAVTETYGAGAIVAEIIKLKPRSVLNGNYHLTLTTNAKLSALMAAAQTALIQSGIHLSISDIVARALTFGDTVKFKPHHTPALQYTVAAHDALVLSVALARYFGGTISEHVSLHSVLSDIYAANATVNEHTLLHAVLSETLQIVLIESETVSLEDTNAVQAMYTQMLSDAIDLGHTYLIPGGGITTWALNTRTGALTEYTNFAFNSMARMGNSGLVYLGANSSGLYQLAGETDAGASIIADMKGGLLAFSGGHLSSIQAAYLGVRGYGQFYLKIQTGSGKEYVYSVQGDPMKNVRVNLGKGLRARYFSYELVSTGQDFDLDSIIFLPVGQQRFVGV